MLMRTEDMGGDADVNHVHATDKGSGDGDTGDKNTDDDHDATGSLNSAAESFDDQFDNENAEDDDIDNDEGDDGEC